MGSLRWLAVAMVSSALTGFAAAQPANDDCSSATPVGVGTFNFDLTGATNSVLASCDSPDAFAPPDVWFNYTASADGAAIISTCGLVDSLFHTVVAAYPDCSGESPLACNFDYCGDGQSTASFQVTAGTHYYIRIATGDQQTPAGQFSISLLPASNCTNPPPGAPSNDCCANATPVAEGNFAFTTANATKDYAGPCDLLSASGDVWFNYQATASGYARVRPDSDAPSDLGVTIVDGACGGAELVCATDLIRGTRQAVFPVVAGGHYLVRLSSINNTDATGHVIIEAIAAPTNDECSGAVPIDGAGTFPFDNTLANNSGPDGDIACDGFGGTGIAHDVWFLWTDNLGAGMDAVISTCGGTYVDTKIAVYNAPCPVGPPIACNDDSCFNQSSVQITPTPGAQYLIRIGNWPGFNGNDGPDGEPGTFSVQAVPTCILTAPAGALIEPEACGTSSNDGCGNFTDIPCGTTTIFGTAPVVNGIQDLDYYRVVCPVATTIHVIGTAEFRMRMAILDDQCPPNSRTQTIFPTHPCDDPAVNELFSDVEPGTYTIGVANVNETPCGAGAHYVITVTVDNCTPTGQCCVNGSCQVISEAACLAAGGSYSGDGTTCPPPGGNYVASTCSDAVEDISSVGQVRSACDDCGDTVDIGFPFSFYGQSFTQAIVSSNGYITLDPNTWGGASFPQTMPSQYFLNMIAPLWNDFTADTGAGAFYTATLGTAPNRRFVAMWDHIESYGVPGSSSTFEAILYEGSNTVAFRYGAIDSGALGGEVGVDNGDGTVGRNFDLASLGTCSVLTLTVDPNPCGARTCTADFNGDGDVGTDADIEAFFACLAGSCCSTCGSADFNGDGDVGTDSDIESFFRVLAGGSC